MSIVGPDVSARDEQGTADAPPPPPSAPGTARDTVDRGGETTLSSRLENLSRRATLNAAASGADFAARTAVELVLNPILLRGLGSSLFGAWRVLWRLTGYLWAMTGRSAQALQSAVANRLGSDDEEEKRRLVAASIVVWAAYLPVMGAMTGLAVWLLPGVLDVAPEHVDAVRWTLVLLGTDAIALSLLSVPRSVLQGENQGYRRLGLSTVLVVAGGIGTATAIWLDWGIVGVGLANLVNTLYTGLLFWRVAKRHVEWFGVARPHRAEVNWFLGLSSWFMLWKLVNQLMLAGDIVLLGAVASVDLVSVYTLTKFAPEAILPLVALLVMGAIPGLGGIIGTGDLERARRVRGEVMALTWLVSVSAAVTIMVWNRSFIDFWVGERYYAGDLENLLLMVTLLQLGIIRNDAFIIDLTLVVKTKVLVGLASAMTSLALAAAFMAVVDSDIVGVCLGLIVGRTILTFIYPWIIGRRIGQSLPGQLRGAARPVVVTGALLGAAHLVSATTAGSSFAMVVPGSLLTGVVALAIGAWVGLSASTRRSLLARSRAIRSRAA